VVFGEQHLNHIVHQFAEHDNTERPQRVTEGDAAGGVRPLAHRKVVRAGQAAGRLRGCCYWPSRRIGFGGKNPRITLEQVAGVVHALVWKCWNQTCRSWAEQIERTNYWQRCNDTSYRSRRRAKQPDTS